MNEKQTRRTGKVAEYRPAGFGLLRSPLLPVSWLERWAEAADGGVSENPSAHAEPRLAPWRTKMASLIEEPLVLEALRLASDHLARSVDNWRSDPESRNGKQTERSLARYMTRMATRPTPLGMLSGVTLFELGERTEIRLSPMPCWRRHTRASLGWLNRIAGHLSTHSSDRSRLVLAVNETLYESGGQFRYAELTSPETGLKKSFRQSQVGATSTIRTAVDLCRHRGTTLGELVRSLGELAPELETSDLLHFVDELLHHQVLVARLSSTNTAERPLESLAGQIRRTLPGESDLAGRLEEISADLRRLDQQPITSTCSQYAEIDRRCAELDPAEHGSRQPQLRTDLFKPAVSSQIGADVLEDLGQVFEWTHVCASIAPLEPLGRFRRRFGERFGHGRYVSLLLALDDDMGIGFDADDATGIIDPLIRDLPFRAESTETVTITPRHQILFQHLCRTLNRGAQVLELSKADVARFPAESSRLDIPDSVAVFAEIAARSQRDLDQGRYLIHFRGWSGPNGYATLGRFCFGDEKLRIHVKDQLTREAAQEPDAAVAELLITADDVTSRPSFSEHEISLWDGGESSASRRLALADIEVTATEHRIHLRSISSGQEIIPRLTSAHNHQLPDNLPHYRFLGAVQHQGQLPGMKWSWGPWAEAPFLPRVQIGRIVLCRAQWRLDGETLSLLRRGSTDARMARFRKLAEERKMPRRLLWCESSDRELYVDIDNPILLESLLAALQHEQSAIFQEVLPSLEDSWVSDGDGRYRSEMVVPYRRVAEKRAGFRAGVIRQAGQGRRDFLPGTEWLSLKLYCGIPTTDQLLTEILGPFVDELEKSSIIRRWYFLRYSDPDWHIRFRIHGEPESLACRVLPGLSRVLEQTRKERLLWRFEVDTYSRELKRYGGSEGIPLAEDYFYRDSQFVISALRHLQQDGLDQRRLLVCMRSISRFLLDCDLQPEQRLALLRNLRDAYRQEFGVDRHLRRKLSSKYRESRDDVRGFIEPASPVQLRQIDELLDRRSERTIETLEKLGRQSVTPQAEILTSLIHMHCVRMIPSKVRIHELLVYDFLFRHHQSALFQSPSRAGA